MHVTLTAPQPRTEGRRITLQPTRREGAVTIYGWRGRITAEAPLMRQFRAQCTGCDTWSLPSFSLGNLRHWAAQHRHDCRAAR